ncbi:PREDICTED: LYR motif-containing protein 4 isoform X1 [Poecilia mexicana]|uniref:LYR motif-containing protein 4 isoform X1 n=1 Tax=Poecilia mexicana TaxID=48701 RepID=UPI00072EED44|nr:PREDICTED: LYR motif-containing protein 4 isoform X1 [Poecilia mexicana]
MAASTRSQVISLYKIMLKESSRFPSYNYRTYALRRVRDAFRANREVEDPKAVERLMDEGEQMLALIQRQTFRRRKRSPLQRIKYYRLLQKSILWRFSVASGFLR